MARSISEPTRAAIMEAAWRLIEREGRVDIGQAAIAAEAGVSRQSIFYAFGDRTGLLTAMARHRDQESPRLARLVEVASERRTDAGQLLDVVSAWIDYLPDVYPVAILLDAAAITDAEAKAAIEDRMIVLFRNGLVARLRSMARRGLLRKGADPDRTAHVVWEICHLRAWRSLVVDCGWTPEEFKSSRLALISTFLGHEA